MIDNHTSIVILLFQSDGELKNNLKGGSVRMTSKFYTGMPGNHMPEEVELPGWQLEPVIVVEMSCGLPEALVRVLEERDGKFFYTTCQAGSQMAQNVPERINDWAKKINIILKANAHLFMDEEYLNTAGDRSTVQRVRLGYRIEDI